VFRPFQPAMAVWLACGFLLPQPVAAARLRADRNHLPAESSGPAQTSAALTANPVAQNDGDNPRARAEWFREGRTTAPGQGTAASKLQREIARKLEMRSSRLASARSLSPSAAQPASSTADLTAQNASAAISTTSALGVQWTPLGPAPIKSYAGQNYGVVTGRVTAIAIDAGDASGNTVFIGAGSGGVWKSTNAAADPALVHWTALTDNQPTLSIGALALKPGNADCSAQSPINCVVLAGTGETDNSGDSYYGLGILRSIDGGQSWTLIDKSADGKLFHGLGFAGIAFNTDSPQIVVAAAAAASEAADVGAEFVGTTRGAYYSSDSGQTWNYAQFKDGTSALAAGSVTSVVYDSARKLFFAAYRFHGIYSSTDGAQWTRLANQPGGPLLSTTACPVVPLGTNCPLYRAELAVQPQTGELFTWFVDANANDQGIFKSPDGGATWTQIHNPAALDGITNCGDLGFSSGVNGCGTDQATFNMELIAVPATGGGTDVYAGAVNVFRCSITNSNPACQNAISWIDLTHVYGCGPTGGPFQPDSHPDQHAIAAVPGQLIIYFGNDGGVYRSLDAPALAGSCGMPFDDLNANLGSLAQLISFSQDPATANTLQVGSQDNGTAATTDTATWNTVGGGDGGYNEIDPNNSGNWLNSGNYVDVAYCAGGASVCNSPVKFSQIVAAGNVNGDAAPFFMRYILDPTNTGQMLVGTCRLWRGSATKSWSTTLGTLISPNFFQQNTQPCGNGDDMIRSIAAGGPAGANGANVIYVGTKNGVVWVTRSPSSSLSSWSGGPLPNASTTCLGKAGCPISDIALDPRDSTGASAYAAVMGFGTAHLYKTTDFGASWTALGSDTQTPPDLRLPDAPANAVLIDPNSSNTIYVGNDIGVFASTDGGQNWSEYGANLPTVPVTQLRAFAAGSVLRASTYGRGLWQAPLAGIVPDFQITLAASSGRVYPTTTATIQGTITPSAGYAQAITVTCDASSVPGLQCNTATVSAGIAQTFTLTVSNATVGDFVFNITASGADRLTHSTPFTLHVSDFAVSLTPTNVTAPHSMPVIVGVNVSPLGSFTGNVTFGCSGAPAGINCSFQPSSVTLLSSASITANIMAGSSVAAGTYSIAITATAADGHTNSAPLSVMVTANPAVVLNVANANLGSAKVGQALNPTLMASSQDGFTGTAALACTQSGNATLATLGSCSVTPSSVTVTSGGAVQPVAIAITTAGATAQSATATVTATSSTSASKLALNYSITDFQVAASGGAFLTGSTAQIPVTITPVSGYTGTVNLACDASAIAGATCTLSPAGPYTVASVPVNVTANVPLNSAAAGTYSLALKATDADFPALSHTAPASVVVQDFTVVPQLQNLTIKAGSAASAVISIAAQNNFSGGVSFSCSGLPAGSICLFTPNVLASVAGGATTVMTISTAKAGAAPPSATVAAKGEQGDMSIEPTAHLQLVTANALSQLGNSASDIGAPRTRDSVQPNVESTTRRRNPDDSGYPLWLSFPLFALVGMASSARKRRSRWIGLLIVLLALITVQFACGGRLGKTTSTPTTTPTQQPGTPAGNYTVTIIATSGSAQRTATITLTVQ
jgi:hypothetical protein